MYIDKECPQCIGRGVTSRRVKALLGLIQRNASATCSLCHGQGRVLTRVSCSNCGGRGLLGNEQQLCRLCNGTGKLDGFSEIPCEELKPGTTFIRSCDKCDGEVFEIAGDVEAIKVQKSWGLEAELQEYEIREQIRIRCLQCANGYYVPINEAIHNKSEADQVRCSSYVKLDGTYRCTNIKCEYYCPDGYCALSDQQQT